MNQQENIAYADDCRFHIPENAVDVEEVGKNDFSDAHTINFSKIDLETKTAKELTMPLMPIRVGEQITYGRAQSSVVKKIVTDMRGIFWIKTESGSYYNLLGGSPDIASRCINKVGGLIRKIFKR